MRANCACSHAPAADGAARPGRSGRQLQLQATVCRDSSQAAAANGGWRCAGPSAAYWGATSRCVLRRADESHGGDESAPSSRAAAAAGRALPVVDALFPDLPGSVPMTYTLTVKACTSAVLEDRPSFKQIWRILTDLEHEVATGTYINSNGFPQVRHL